MVLLSAFAIAAGLCLWLYWRERQERRRLEDRLRTIEEARRG